MKKIELVEGCFGSDILIDDESLHLHEYDNRSEDDVRKLKISLINKLLTIVDNLSVYDLKNIGEIVVSYDGWLQDYENSSQNTCGQCGNFNENTIFLKDE